MEPEGTTVVKVVVLVLTCVALVLFISYDKYKENTEVHSDDIIVTEWVSPDGVHYWYHDSGYGRMLAPRYDVSGNLVIEK